MNLSQHQSTTIQRLWGSYPPSHIGHWTHPKMTGEAVKRAAAEMGLPPYVYPKERRDLARQAPKCPRERDDGMIEFAPGHVMARDSWRVYLAPKDAR